MPKPSHDPNSIVRKLNLIDRYSRANLVKDNKMRDTIKWRLQMTTEELDDIVHEETDRVWQQINCLDCGNCCRILSLVVDEEDVIRLSKHLKMSKRDFEKRYIQRAKDTGAMTFAKSPPCPFLGDDNACRVYEARPKCCHDYPYLHDHNFRSRSLSMLENLPTCPIVYNVWQALRARLFGGKK